MQHGVELFDKAESCEYPLAASVAFKVGIGWYGVRKMQLICCPFHPWGIHLHSE
jgi:hypothetical protein